MTAATRCIWRILLPAWVAAGAVLYFLADALFEKLFIFAILPWGGWLIAGLALFGLCLREAWRARGSYLAIPIVLVVPTAFGLLLLLAGPALEPIGARFACCAHPSDASLIRNFRAHRPEFEELRTMFTEDRQLGRVAPDFTRSASFFSGAPMPPGAPVTQARLAAYRRRFRDLRLASGVEGYDDKKQIWFIASTRGISLSGSVKGYLHSPTRPTSVVASLDPLGRDGNQVLTAYRHIDGDWYLYIEFFYD